MSILLDSDALTGLFCHVDDFCRGFLPAWKARQLATPTRRNRARSLSESEMMTILVAFHHSGYRTFKAFYTGYVCQHWRDAFPVTIAAIAPGLVSYHRFVELTPSVVVALFLYLQSLLGKCTGITFADSTALAVCENPRIGQHRVFLGAAKRGKTSTGWFQVNASIYRFGFKLHLLTTTKASCST